MLTLALIEDVNFLPKFLGAANGGDTGSGIQDDLELTQTSQLPLLRRIVGAFVQNVPMIEVIDSHLGDLRPRAQLLIMEMTYFAPIIQPNECPRWIWFEFSS